MPNSQANEIIKEIAHVAHNQLVNMKFLATFHVGMAYVIYYPHVIDKSKLHTDFDLKDEFGNVDIKFNSVKDILGLMANIDRSAASNDLVRSCRRQLVCEPYELSVDALGRAASTLADGKDPLLSRNYFGVELKDSWANTQKKAGSLILKEDRKFFKELVNPIRNIVRHNRAELYPGKKINYSGQPRRYQFEIRHTYEPGKDNELRWLMTKTAYQIFETIFEITIDGLTKALNQGS